MSICRACGVELDGIGKYTLESLNVSTLPPFCEGLCMVCLDCIRVPHDEEGMPLRAVEERDVVEFLVAKVRQIAFRVSQGQPVIRCEAMVNGMYGDWQRCNRFASRQRDGRRICGMCERSVLRGREISYVDERKPQARCFVFWVRTHEELISLAQANTEGFA